MKFSFEMFGGKHEERSEEEKGQAVHEVATPQEAESKFTYENVQDGIREAANAMAESDSAFRAEDMMSMTDAFEDILVEKDVLKAKDLSFESTHDIVKKAAREVAREMLAEKDRIRDMRRAGPVKAQKLDDAA